MISVKENNGEIEGRRIDLMHDFCLIVHMLAENNVMSKEMMLDIVNHFAISDKEKIKKNLIAEIDKMDNIGDALNLLGQVMNDRRFK